MDVVPVLYRHRTGGVIITTLSSVPFVLIRLLLFITSLQPALAVVHLKSSIIIVVLGESDEAHHKRFLTLMVKPVMLTECL